MAYDDTKWGGFAKIIVDTSTMSVGDTVRVKSVTTGTNYDKQVVTVGTPLIWETDIYKDYVKICMVQTINDTPTEIGGVYRTVDYGQTLFINVLDKTTLGGIQGILNSHQETSLLNIGDEVDITVNGSPWTMQIAGINIYDSHEVIFASKYFYTTGQYSTTNNVPYSSSSCLLRQNNEAFYNAMSETDKAFLKDWTKTPRDYSTVHSYTAKVQAPMINEVGASVSRAYTIPPVLLPLFSTQASRVKTDVNGVGESWWSSEYDHDSSGMYMNVVSELGVATANEKWNGTGGTVPLFRLLADS